MSIINRFSTMLSELHRSQEADVDKLIAALDKLTLHPKSGFGRAQLSSLTRENKRRDIDHLFASHLTDLRTAAGLTQKQLGDQLGVTDQTVSNWTTQATTPPAAIRDAVTYYLIDRTIGRMDQEVQIPPERIERALNHFHTLIDLRSYLFSSRVPAALTTDKLSGSKFIEDPVIVWNSSRIAGQKNRKPTRPKRDS